MARYGKYNFSVTGHMLDEVKSLLHKAFRRKLDDKVSQSLYELNTKVKLHFFVTYLLEDHGTNSVETLSLFIKAMKDMKYKKKRFMAVMDIANIILCLKPSRTAAVLPVSSTNTSPELLKKILFFEKFDSTTKNLQCQLRRGNDGTAHLEMQAAYHLWRQVIEGELNHSDLIQYSKASLLLLACLMDDDEVVPVDKVVAGKKYRKTALKGGMLFDIY